MKRFVLLGAWLLILGWVGFASAAAAPDLSGQWKSTNGPILWALEGSILTGTYNAAEHGKLVGTLTDRVFDGHWIEDKANRRCEAPRDGRHYWGRVRFTFDGNVFSGAWGYCEAEPKEKWTGSRKAVPALDIAGTWKSTNGALTFTQRGAEVSGQYNPKEHGAVLGVLRGAVLDGYWIEDKANRRCAAPREGRHYWGRVRFTFDGNAFSGAWGYCEAEPKEKWTGSRSTGSR